MLQRFSVVGRLPAASLALCGRKAKAEDPEDRLELLDGARHPRLRRTQWEEVSTVIHHTFAFDRWGRNMAGSKKMSFPRGLKMRLMKYPLLFILAAFEQVPWLVMLKNVLWTANTTSFHDHITVPGQACLPSKIKKRPVENSLANNPTPHFLWSESKYVFALFAKSKWPSTQTPQSCSS